MWRKNEARAPSLSEEKPSPEQPAAVNPTMFRSKPGSGLELPLAEKVSQVRI